MQRGRKGKATAQLIKDNNYQKNNLPCMYPNIQEYGGPLVQFSFVVSHVDCFSVFILLAFRFPIFVARAVQFSFFVFLAF